jgi:hypothetical protein
MGQLLRALDGARLAQFDAAVCRRLLADDIQGMRRERIPIRGQQWETPEAHAIFKYRDSWLTM